MPVILEGSDRDVWLDPATPPERLVALLASPAEQPLAADAVSTLVNSPGNDAPECVLPLEVLHASRGGE
jgi:putative SOS response-associated peptidase YedK